MNENKTLNNPQTPACFLPHVTGCADSKPKLLDLYCGGGGASFNVSPATISGVINYKTWCHV